jgi:hypothetical protein
LRQFQLGHFLSERAGGAISESLRSREELLREERLLVDEPQRITSMTD